MWVFRVKPIIHVIITCIYTKLGWNSLMETVRKNSKEENPVDIFAAQNEAIQKEMIKAKLAKNQQLEKDLGRKSWELANKQKFLEENQIID